LWEPTQSKLVLGENASQATQFAAAGTTAHAFHAYLHQPAARAIFVRYGFVLPDER